MNQTSVSPWIKKYCANASYKLNQTSVTQPVCHSLLIQTTARLWVQYLYFPAVHLNMDTVRPKPVKTIWIKTGVNRSAVARVLTVAPPIRSLYYRLYTVLYKGQNHSMQKKKKKNINKKKGKHQLMLQFKKNINM